MDYVNGVRISDSERERFVEELGRHLAAGRLTIGEFDQRVAEVYRSVTTEEARRVLRDLPAASTPPGTGASTPPGTGASTPPGTSASTPPATGVRGPAPHRSARARMPLHQRIEWAAWAAAGALNLAIWAVVSIAVGAAVYPWPIWVIGPWGLVLLGRTLTGREGGAGCAHRRGRRSARPLPTAGWCASHGRL